MKDVINTPLFRKIRGERPRWKDRHNIKMILIGVYRDYVDWIEVARIGSNSGLL
jgi:hypothetical protein